MFGAIVGDIIGSRFEFNNIKSKEFDLLTEENRFTDDSVLTLAIAQYFLKYPNELNKEKLIFEIKNLAKSHLNAGYGPSFFRWIDSSTSLPYNSYGNGSAMRVSPVSYVSKSLEEVKRLSNFVTSITHNHLEGLKGAEAISTSIFLLLHGSTKAQLKEYIENNYYKMDFDYEDLVKNYKFEISCQKSVPQSLYIFLISKNYIDAIRNAISIGGDSDTICDMVLALSEAYFLNKNNLEGFNITLKLSQEERNEIKIINKKAISYLTKDLHDICKDFEQKYDIFVDKNFHLFN